MIREILKPTKNQILINIPDDFVNKDLELLIFPISETKKASIDKKLGRLMEKNFKKAKTVHIPKDLDLDNLMNEMNDALS